MKILIVDDEPLALSRLRRLLESLGHSYITACTNATEAMEAIQKETFYVAFLDISMEGQNGIELGHALRSGHEDLAIIYQTAHENHALDAFRVGAIDYLLKPYTTEMIHRALERIKTAEKPKELRFIAKAGDVHRLLTPDEILYVQADLNEVIFRTAEEFCYYPKKISELEMLLESYGFFRVHRSYLINLDGIREMETIEQSRIRFTFWDIKEYVDSSKDGAKHFRDRYKGESS